MPASYSYNRKIDSTLRNFRAHLPNVSSSGMSLCLSLSTFIHFYLFLIIFSYQNWCQNGPVKRSDMHFFVSNISLSCPAKGRIKINGQRASCDSWLWLMTRRAIQQITGSLSRDKRVTRVDKTIDIDNMTRVRIEDKRNIVTAFSMDADANAGLPWRDTMTSDYDVRHHNSGIHRSREKKRKTWLSRADKAAMIHMYAFIRTYRDRDWNSAFASRLMDTH